MKDWHFWEDRLGTSTFCGVAELCHCNATKQYYEWHQNEQTHVRILKNRKTPLNTEYQRPHPILIVITKRQVLCRRSYQSQFHQFDFLTRLYVLLECQTGKLTQTTHELYVCRPTIYCLSQSNLPLPCYFFATNLFVEPRQLLVWFYDEPEKNNTIIFSHTGDKSCRIRCHLIYQHFVNVHFNGPHSGSLLA